ncbi:MAG: hypothetical protein JO279_02140 [Verrucomicrobia bacterium]|nr:hypothetical protein [Verrucomicrobiota bacterium]
MNTALSVSACQEVSSRTPPNADAGHEIWEPLDLLVEESACLATWRSFTVEGHLIPSYVFIGPRGRSVPIRLALLGGIKPEDLVSTDAIVKLLVELELAPLLAQDFALFGYPVANPVRISGRPPDFAADFWADAPVPDPTIRYFEQELAGNQLDGVIAAEGNEAISGFQFKVSSRVIAAEVLWPALDIVQKLVPLAREPVQILPPPENSRHSLFSIGQLRPGSFSIIISTPRRVPFDHQISAIAFSIKQILHRYRTLVDHADKL